MALGAVKGDLHDIGKNLVRMMMEGAGLEVIDLGVDVAPEAFVQAVKEQGVQNITMSALLTTTMPSMKEAIEALQQAGVREQVKVMIGGAPVTQRFADETGADAYTPRCCHRCRPCAGAVGVIAHSLRMLRMMVNGDWNEAEFLICPPHHRVAANHSGLKMRAESIVYGGAS